MNNIVKFPMFEILARMNYHIVENNTEPLFVGYKLKCNDLHCYYKFELAVEHLVANNYNKHIIIKAESEGPMFKLSTKEIINEYKIVEIHNYTFNEFKKMLLIC